MKYRLDRRSLERAKALVRANKFVDEPVETPVLQDPPNWPEFRLRHLGLEIGKPESVAENGVTDQTPHAEWYAYPYTNDGENLNLAWLRKTVADAKAAGESDIADAAQICLGLASEKELDRAAMQQRLKGESYEDFNRDIRWTADGTATIKAGEGAAHLPTFDLDAWTGTPLLLENFDAPVVVDYAGLQVSQKARPVLLAHNREKQLGHTTNVFVAAGILRATGVFSGVGKWVDETVAAGLRGFPWQVSIGAKVLKGERVPQGKKVTVNGLEYDGPVIVSRSTSLQEISILTLGADDATSARIAAEAARTGSMKGKLKAKFAAWAKAHGFKTENLLGDDGFLSSCKAAFKAETKCEADDEKDSDYEDKPDGKDGKGAALAGDIQAAAPVSTATLVADAVAEIRAGAIAEGKRLAEIRKLLGDFQGRVDGDKFIEIEAHAIAGEWDKNKVHLELVQNARPSVKNFMANTGKGSSLTGNIYAAAILRKCVSEKVAYMGLPPDAANIAASLNNVSLHKLIAAMAGNVGLMAHAGGINDDFLSEFTAKDRASHISQFNHQREAYGDIMAAGAGGGGFTTMSLTGITENILYKMMLEMYAMQASVVDEICYQRDTQDFKQYKVYRLTASGDLSVVTATGELESISLQDASYSNQVSTRGALMVLTRENMINDDMGALMQSAQILGRKSALNREKAVLTTFLSGLSTTAPGASVGKTANSFYFWSSGAKNYLSGATSALSISSLTNAMVAFMQQTDDNGDPIGLLPDRLLVPPELKVTADNLFRGASLTVQALATTAVTSGPVQNAQTASQVPNLNAHQGMYRPLVTPFLGAASPIAGASATQWALLPSPAGGSATVQVGYLRGQRTPIIRQVELEANRLGLGFQVIYDFGVSLLDWRCGVYSAGT